MHRLNTLDEFFKNGYRITAIKEVAEYVKRHVKNPIIIGPDEESFQWVEQVAQMLNTKAITMRKKRISPKRMKVKTQTLDMIKNKTPVVVDDIISTGKTMIEVIKKLRFNKTKIYVIAIHGIFAEDTLPQLKAICKVVTTNTIPSSTSKIDITPEVVRTLKQLRIYEEKSSKQVAKLASSYGLPLVMKKPDVSVDGADQVDENLNILKGHSLLLL